MKLYLSGPITGVENYKQAFMEAEQKLLSLDDDIKIVNPAKWEYPDYKWADYMILGIDELRFSDGIVMLPGWEKSKGAQIELLFAEGSVIKVFHFDALVKELEKLDKIKRA